MRRIQILWSDLQRSALFNNVFVSLFVGNLLLILLGPLPFIPLLKRMKQQPQRSVRHSWKHVLAAARWPLLLYGTLLYLHQPISWLWANFFVLLAAWTQKPALIWIGQETLWPLSMDNLLFRWVFAWPLAVFVSHLLTPQHQPAYRRFRRVLTPQDQPAAPVQVQEKSPQVIHHSHRKSQSRRPGKTSSGSQIKQTPSKMPVGLTQIPLRGSTHWKVPNTDSLKQPETAATQLRLQPIESTQTGAQSVQHISAEPEAPPGLEQDDDWDIDKGVLTL